MGRMLKIILIALTTTAYAGMYDQPTPPDAPLYNPYNRDGNRHIQELYNTDVNTYNTEMEIYHRRQRRQEREDNFRQEINDTIQRGYDND